ncbi:MAG TPA: fatty acid desaturase [Methylocystis sp.]|nr:fatty acid desaturase [Methylocystis sp.]
MAKCLAHPADRANVLRGLFTPLLFFAPFAFPDLGAQGFFCVLILWPIIGDTNYILHLHAHRPFSNYRTLNLWLDLSLGAVTGITASNWRIQHVLGHHRGEDHVYRAAPRGELTRYTARGALGFSLRSLWPTFAAPLAEAYRKGCLARLRKPIDYRWAFAEQCLSIALAAALFAFRPALTLAYLLPWYALNYLVSRYVDYLNHYGCQENGSPFERCNNSLNPWFNRLTHNFGHHTAHHLRPEAHWTELPSIHARIAHQIPERCLKRFSWSFAMTPYHLYLSAKGRM